MSVGAAPNSLVVTAMASEMRDSSPPDATLPTGLGVMPGCPATKNTTSSIPSGEGSAALLTDTSNLPPSMPSPCMAREMVAESLGAALARAIESVRAAAWYALALADSLACSLSRSEAASSSCRDAFQSLSSEGSSAGGRLYRRASPIHWDMRSSSSVSRCGSMSAWRR